MEAMDRLKGGLDTGLAILIGHHFGQTTTFYRCMLCEFLHGFEFSRSAPTTTIRFRHEVAPKMFYKCIKPRGFTATAIARVATRFHVETEVVRALISAKGLRPRLEAGI